MLCCCVREREWRKALIPSASTSWAVFVFPTFIQPMHMASAPIHKTLNFWPNIYSTYIYIFSLFSYIFTFHFISSHTIFYFSTFSSTTDKATPFGLKCPSDTVLFCFGRGFKQCASDIFISRVNTLTSIIFQFHHAKTFYSRL